MNLKIAAIRQRKHDTKRAGEIVGVFVKYGLADWFKAWHVAWIQERIKSFDGRPISELTLAERLRLAFTELGPTFIKLGQLLGTRPDVVGMEIAAELARLQIAAPADPPGAVRATIEAELGRPPEQLFAEFEEKPFASASIAQCHRATLPTGEEVVVKVQHAGILGKIRSDLDILTDLAELAEKYASRLRAYQPIALVQQFRRTLLRELDFDTERRNLEEFATHFADDPTVHFPTACKEFSSRRVLTMERLDGILGSDTASLAESGADLDAFARRGANMYLQMIFRDAFYHADPHPGNLMLLPGGVVGVLDCGMTGRLDEGLAQDVEDMLLAVAKSNSTDLAEILLRVGSAPPGIARDQFRAEVNDLVADYTSSSIQELNVCSALNDLAELIRRHKIMLPPPLSLLLRTLVELEGTAQKLNPQFSLAEVIRPFYTRMVHRRLSPRRILSRMQRNYRGWERLVESLPHDLGDVTKRIRDGTFSVHLHHRNLDLVVNRLVLGVVTAALIIGSSLLWSMKAPPAVRGVSVIAGVGYLVAIYLGWRLMHAVKESGNIATK